MKQFSIEEVKNYKGRTLQGVVVGNSADKTIKVKIERLVKHKLYGKFIKRSLNLLVHDENNKCKLNDTVLIKEGKPISKRKAWVLVDILESVS